MSSPSTQERITEMSEKGYTIFESLFSTDEMARLDADLKSYEETLGREDLDAREVVFTQKIAERDENVCAFAQRAEFAKISAMFLGPDTDLYFNQKVYKNPHGTSTFSWHQDDAYGRVEPSPYLTIWIAINEATVENGCISVLPGSHKRGFVEHWDSSFGWACHHLDDPDQGVAVPLATGSVACLWSQTMHKSGPNLTSGVRKGLILQFSPVGLRHLSSGMTIRSRTPIARNGSPAILKI